MPRTVQGTFDALGVLPIEPKPVETGALKKQFRDMCNELLTTTLSPAEYWAYWRLVQDAVEHALPGPPVKSDKAVANYDRLVAEGRSTERSHHQKTKEDACRGICSPRRLEHRLLGRLKSK
jgi:hypothetical protein